MSADYTGLHGRSPYEPDSHSDTRAHFVPEGWEEADRGICPRCGRTVRWDADSAEWILEPTMRVLVLTATEADVALGALDFAGRQDADADDLRELVELMVSIQEPIVDRIDTDYSNPMAVDFDPKAAQDAGH